MKGENSHCSVPFSRTWPESTQLNTKLASIDALNPPQATCSPPYPVLHMLCVLFWLRYASSSRIKAPL